MRKDYNIPTPLRVSIFFFRSQFSLTHIKKHGRCTISSEQKCTTFYKFLKEPENDTKKLTQHNFLGKRRYYDWMQIIKKKHKQMARRLGRQIGDQIGDRRDNFSRQSFFLLAMATKTVAAWSAAEWFFFRRNVQAGREIGVWILQALLSLYDSLNISEWFKL